MTHLNRLDIDVPPGAPEGFEVVLDGEADENPDWEAGDIVVRVRSKPSVGEAGGWRRKDAGLYRREILSVDEVSNFPTGLDCRSFCGRRFLDLSAILRISTDTSCR
jgi:hypothetical protein